MLWCDSGFQKALLALPQKFTDSQLCEQAVIYGTIRDEEAFPFLVDVEIVESGPVVMLYDFGPEFCFDCEIGIKQ